MGVFDLFGRTPRTKDNTAAKPFATSEPQSGFEHKAGPVTVFDPKSYDEVAAMIDALRDGKNIIVHLEKLKKETALRILDLLSGAIYALHGGVYEMEENIFMFSPTGVEIL